MRPDFSMFDDLGMSRMQLLPPEILQIIYRDSATSLSWRYCAASKLSEQLPAVSSEQLFSIPLCTVSAWERGSRPVILEAIHHLPVIRLTIDSRGIKRVERLSGHPQFNRWRTDSQVFVTLDQRDLDGVSAHFKVNAPSSSS